MSHAPVTQPVFIPLPPPDPVTMAVLEACDRMPDSHLVKTAPLGELIAFAHALRIALGVPASRGETFCGQTPNSDRAGST